MNLTEQILAGVNAGHNTVSGLCWLLPNVSPMEIADELDRLTKAGQLTHRLVARVSTYGIASH